MLTHKDDDPISYVCQSTNMLSTPLADGLIGFSETQNADVYVVSVAVSIPNTRSRTAKNKLRHFIPCVQALSRFPGQTESSDPIFHFPSQLNNLDNLFPFTNKLPKSGHAPRILPSALLRALPSLPIKRLGDVDSAVDDISYTTEIRGGESSRGHSGRTHAESTRSHGRFVSRYGVLIRGYAHEFQNPFYARSVDGLVFQIYQNEVIICAATHDVVTQSAGGFVVA